MHRNPFPYVNMALLAGVLMAASPTLAQTPVFLDAPGSADVPSSVLEGPDDPDYVLTHYARVNVLGIAQRSALLRVDMPGREPALMTEQRFNPRVGFDLLRPPPGAEPGDLSYDWSGHSTHDDPLSWASLDLYVSQGNLLGRLLTVDGLFILSGPWDQSRVRLFDSRLSSEIVYPPFEVSEADIRPGIDLLPERASRAPGESLVVRVTVRNHGPDASAGGLFIFDPAPFPDRLWIQQRLPPVYGVFVHCHSLQFQVPGFPGKQVQRIAFGPLQAGESAHCDLPATVQPTAGGSIEVAGRLFPFASTGARVIRDPLPGNEDASAAIAVHGLSARPIPGPGPALGALLATLVLLAAFVRLHRARD